MSPISVPSKRTYYPASPTEQTRLLLWIPREELESMIEEDLIPEEVLAEYPDGAEVEVTAAGFQELGIDLGISPEVISATYEELMEEGQVPESGLVDGATLERVAQEIVDTTDDVGPPRITPEVLERVSPLTVEGLPEPEMTDGEEAETFLRDL
jgi:hypothetical protein